MDELIYILPASVYLPPIAASAFFRPPFRWGFLYYVALLIPLLNIVAVIVAWRDGP